MDLSKKPGPAEQHHHNSGLFSDHYLNVTLPRRTDWQELASEARAIMEKLAEVFAAYTPSKNESQTETGLIQPVLNVLGHDFEVQASLQTPEGTKKPDYVFYKDAAAQNINKNRTLNEDLLSGKSFAVGDAKYWDRPLDVSIKGKQKDSLTNNPSFQISFYMRHAGTDWGILTNGRLWRLYHRETAHKLDRFYEVDLQELVESGDAERFLYFYAFFRRTAFDSGPLGVSSILQASTDYALGVGDSLKSQVYEALRHLAQGFLDYPNNELDAADPEKLQDIYDNSLILLYRLLFVLYAEARELLPVRGRELYRESYSLHRIKHDVAGGPKLLPTSGKLWNDLKELFQSIDKGNPPLSVATFNGGLFDPARHPFLEEYAVGDAHLQGAIDRISRVKGEFVDYRDLSERHLGTIYEGLLEFHLRPLQEPEDGWTVDLLNDNDERKATGSYYTPDFVVKYIVEQTVGPMLEAAVEGAPSDAAKVEAVLALDVLDPAMGSGHFLVEVTEYIARFLVGLDVSPEEAGDEEGA
ncbi:class I SAM-dependent DNA methyltransferase [soil metagenome]